MSVPKHISHDTLQAAVRALGLDPANIKSLTVDVDSVAVTEFVTRQDGARHLCEECTDHFETRTVHIPVRKAPAFAPTRIVGKPGDPGSIRIFGGVL
ncbi:MAG TPA: hypothetical protein VIO38_09545 [Rariglobus sp.]